MIKQRILTLILFIMMVIFCVAEALVISDLKSKSEDMTAKISELEDAAATHDTDIARMKDDINGKENRIDPELFLPKDLYVCPGMTVEVYNTNVCTNIDISDLSFFWECAIGDCMEDRFRVKPSSDQTGEYPVILHVFDESMIEIADANTTLHVVKDVFSGNTVSGAGIVTIGDSLSAGTEWMRYVREKSGDKIEHIGRAGDEDGIHYESVPGIAPAEMYYGKLFGMDSPNSFTNPDTGVFDWDYYIRTTGFKPDCVQIFIGMNGLDMDPSDNVEVIFDMIENIKNCDPDMPILLSLPVFPSDQNGMAVMQNTPGYESMRGINAAERRLMIANLDKALTDAAADYDDVVLVPTALCFDTVNGFNQVLESANPHSEITAVYPSEGIHPGTAGYRQIGDEIYAALCYMSEKKNVRFDSDTSVSADDAADEVLSVGALTE